MSKHFLKLSFGLRKSHRWFAGVSPLAFILSGVSGFIGLGAIGLNALPVEAVDFPATSDRGAPGRTIGGGTRGDWCDSFEWSEDSLLALVPDNNVSTFAHEDAALWLHVSDMFSSLPAELYVQDAETFEPVYQQEIHIEEIDGSRLVKMQLPSRDAAGAPLLEVGKNYYWEFAVICDTNDRTRDYVTRGFLHRMETPVELTAALETVSQPEERANLYAQAELWQETLETVAAVRTSEPDLWNSLMRSVGLEIVVTPGSINNANPSNINSADDSDGPNQLTGYRPDDAVVTPDTAVPSN